MKRQSSADTTVGMAHGTSTAARTSARPRKARFIASASRQPSSSSSVTRHDREQERVRQRLAEPGVAHGLEIVVDADERAAEPRHAQVVQMHGLPERPEQWEKRDEEDRGHRRRGEGPCQAGLAALRRSRRHGDVSAPHAIAPSPRPTRSSRACISAAALASAGPGSSCRVSARCRYTCRMSESWV